MHQLAGRLTALDPDAGQALRVIAYFDELIHQRTGLESIVRGAAVLSGATARLSTPGRKVALRVTPEGIRDDDGAEPVTEWQALTLKDPDVTMWLERPGPSGPVDAMVLERAAGAARTVLERTRGRAAPAQHDGELVELLLDPQAPQQARDHAIRALGFKPGQTIRVVARGGTLELVAAHRETRPGREETTEPPPGDGRMGVGAPVQVEDAASSADQAQLAYLLTAEGTAADPGDRVVWADRLGAALLIAQASAAHPEWAHHPDVEAVHASANQTPWFLTTLAAVSTTDSLRAAATVLLVHHSTLQQRLAQINKGLGWDVMTPTGKLRLQMALLIRRLEQGRHHASGGT